MTRQIRNAGRSIDRLPARAVLQHEDAPKEIGSALDSWAVALDDLKEASRAHREAEKVAQADTLKVRGESARWRAEVDEKVKEERAALQAAERVSTEAARAVVAVLDEHREAIGTLSARLALEAHAEAVDLALDLGGARSRFSAVAPGGFALRPDVDVVVETRRRSAVVPRSVSEELDLVDAHGLAERAGTRLDLAEVVSRDGVRVLTTPRRADVLVGNGSTTWRYYLGEEASA